MSLPWFRLVLLVVLSCKDHEFLPCSWYVICLQGPSAFLICDRVGRIWATRILCTIWALGVVIFMIGGVNGNLGAIYAGRFICGLGVGQTPVVG